MKSDAAAKLLLDSRSMLDRRWFVNSIARDAEHKSCVGPFWNPVQAAEYINKHRPTTHWKSVTITSQTKRRRRYAA